MHRRHIFTLLVTLRRAHSQASATLPSRDVPRRAASAPNSRVHDNTESTDAAAPAHHSAMPVPQAHSALPVPNDTAQVRFSLQLLPHTRTCFNVHSWQALGAPEPARRTRPHAALPAADDALAAQVCDSLQHPFNIDTCPVASAMSCVYPGAGRCRGTLHLHLTGCYL